MSDLRDNLRHEFADPDYRYAYAQSFLNTKVATQIKVLREQRDMKQAELATLCGTKQAGFSRFEDVNHSVWKTDTLWKIARALGVRLNISFESFGSLIDEKEKFTREYLRRPKFEDDPAFAENEALETGRSLALARDKITDIGQYRSAKEREVSTEYILGQVASATISAIDRQEPDTEAFNQIRSLPARYGVSG